jgi:hypothetical protein
MNIWISIICFILFYCQSVYSNEANSTLKSKSKRFDQFNNGLIKTQTNNDNGGSGNAGGSGGFQQFNNGLIKEQINNENKDGWKKREWSWQSDFNQNNFNNMGSQVNVQNNFKRFVKHNKGPIENQVNNENQASTFLKTIPKKLECDLKRSWNRRSNVCQGGMKKRFVQHNNGPIKFQTNNENQEWGPQGPRPYGPPQGPRPAGPPLGPRPAGPPQGLRPARPPQGPSGGNGNFNQNNFGNMKFQQNTQNIRGKRFVQHNNGPIKFQTNNENQGPRPVGRPQGPRPAGPPQGPSGGNGNFNQNNFGNMGFQENTQNNFKRFVQHNIGPIENQQNNENQLQKQFKRDCGSKRCATQQVNNGPVKNQFNTDGALNKAVKKVWFGDMDSWFGDN